MKETRYNVGIRAMFTFLKQRKESPLPLATGNIFQHFPVRRGEVPVRIRLHQKQDDEECSSGLDFQRANKNDIEKLTTKTSTG